MKKTATFVSIVIAAHFCAAICRAQQNAPLNDDPEAVRFITSDIDNFWRAFDLAVKEPDRTKKIAIFDAEYFGKGSNGLRNFNTLRINGAANLVAKIESMPKYYASIRDSTHKVSSMKGSMLASFKKLKRIYPQAKFPDVYFLIGRASSGGTTGPAGLLIGTEMYSLTPEAPRTELGESLSAVLKPIEDIPGIVAHELIHYVQNNGETRTLLDRSLREGAADFLGQLISGKNINTKAYEYGHENEKALWSEFVAEMDGLLTAKWLYNGGTIKDRPADLGYFIGFKICEAYYTKARNKNQTVFDILNHKYSKALLVKSGYAGN